mmetsp:Transcript_54298/g.156111  ORF Transcript_54298/g.156111 Transcript_54298/m.156111 type:complete len:533 (+) Transcript_54298:72-1670(+)
MFECFSDEELLGDFDVDPLNGRSPNTQRLLEAAASRLEHEDSPLLNFVASPARRVVSSSSYAPYQEFKVLVPSHNARRLRLDCPDVEMPEESPTSSSSDWLSGNTIAQGGKQLPPEVKARITREQLTAVLMMLLCGGWVLLILVSLASHGAVSFPKPEALAVHRACVNTSNGSNSSNLSICSELGELDTFGVSSSTTTSTPLDDTKRFSTSTSRLVADQASRDHTPESTTSFTSASTASTSTISTTHAFTATHTTTTRTFTTVTTTSSTKTRTSTTTSTITKTLTTTTQTWTTSSSTTTPNPVVGSIGHLRVEVASLVGDNLERLAEVVFVYSASAQSPQQPLIRQGSYQLSLAKAEDPLSTNGCLCQPWQLDGYPKCAFSWNSFCCNPNDDPAGPWCMTDGACTDRAWDRCEPSSPAVEIKDQGGKLLSTAKLRVGFTGNDLVQSLSASGAGASLLLMPASLQTETVSAPLTIMGCYCKPSPRCNATSGWCCKEGSSSGASICSVEGDCYGRAWDFCTPAIANRAIFEFEP